MLVETKSGGKPLFLTCSFFDGALRRNGLFFPGRPGEGTSQEEGLAPALRIN